MRLIRLRSSMKAVVYDAPGSFTITEIPAPDPKPGEVRTGRARTEGLITHRFVLDDYPRALDALRGDRTVHKIIIECWQR